MRRGLIALGTLLAVMGAGSRINGQDASTVITAAAHTMGADTLKTLVLTGSGSVGTLGQNATPASAWPLVRLARYTRTVDIETLSSNFESVRVQNDRESSQNQVIPAKSPWARQADLWVATPYAFLKGAMTNPLTLRSEMVDGVRYTVVSFKVDGKYAVEGFISEKNLVERIRTWMDSDVLGDMPVEGVYRDYVDRAGVQVPSLTIVRQGGYPTLIAGVTDAKVNTPVSIPAAAPQPVASAPVPPAVAVEKVAEGVYYLKGGTHHSVLVEFVDHLTLIEGPQNEARSIAVLQAIKKLYPRKPLTQVVNTHHHFDHAGGLRTFVDAGATIVTHEMNRAFFDAAFKAPRTLNPDRLQQSRRAATMTSVSERLVLRDATRTVELHQVKGNAHDEGMLVAFLPREKVLVEVDMYTPPAADAQAPAAGTPANSNTVALVASLERLRLDFDTILPLHGATKSTRAELYAFIKKPLVPVSELPDPDAPTTDGRGGRPRGTALPPPDLGNMP